MIRPRVPWPLARAVLHALPPETAHGLSLWGLARGLAGAAPGLPDPILGQTLWGLRFDGPVGLAAGYDKDARAIRGAFGLGFGFVEVGTLTPKPQPGNPRPRLFRLPEDGAVINRLGFNNGGMAAAAERIARARASGLPGVLGINIGKNKDQADAAADYAAGAERLGPLADYVAVNVSSPNTPGLRDLQAVSELRELLAAVRGALEKACGDASPPVLVKLAPDLDDTALAEIAALARSGAMDGLIVTNTTIGRPEGLRGRHRGQAGGLSGRPLFDLSTRVLRALYRETGGALPLIGVGGISDAGDAYAKICAGASLVALYTALIYRGPRLVARINTGLAERLRADGHKALSDAVGTAA